jgi:3-oxoadipate enol-lactonase/4-carboxymuconolactone decarboxylase
MSGFRYDEAMIRFIDSGGVTIRVVDSGPPGAPAVLLIHSLGTCLELWDAQAEALARSHRVIRYDLRGHGLSQLGSISLELLAADGLAVLDALGVDSAHVGGISVGGMVAMTLAAAAPARVRSLILCDTALAFPPPQRWRDRAALVRSEGIELIIEDTLARWVSPAYAATPDGRGLRAILGRTSVEGYAATAEMLASVDLSGLKLAARALVIVGERDVSSPPATAHAVAAAIDGARVVVIPGGYHLPLGEHAREVNVAIGAHLGGPVDGARVRAEVLGADHVARTTAAITDLDRDFQAFLTRSAWGEVWGRPHFDRRTRSIVTLAVLAALGRDEEFALHVRAMRNTGATIEDLAELLLHVAVYAGVPAANAAMRLAKRVLAETP